ncbi:uncharacterized protein LOC127468401 isoform X2 [Manacus candei]|uniref:uncharacterized protein LOC127468401 isoform X2 n=1 Tax=Manacus candei TaxID=415023 RepID=UPI0022273AAA|nr:uncharacterized protein LOC127468401 isoform X2 [Manacus candei]
MFRSPVLSSTEKASAPRRPPYIPAPPPDSLRSALRMDIHRMPLAKKHESPRNEPPFPRLCPGTAACVFLGSTNTSKHGHGLVHGQDKMQKETEGSENCEGLLPQSCCYHRAANEEKTAAWISCAVEDSRSDPVGHSVAVSKELPASQNVHSLRLEAAPPYYHDSQLQVEVQWMKGQDGSKLFENFRKMIKGRGTCSLRISSIYMEGVKTESCLCRHSIKPQCLQASYSSENLSFQFLKICY